MVLEPLQKLCAGCGRYSSLAFSDSKLTKKQCVNPCLIFSGLLFVPHSKYFTAFIFEGSSLDASSTFFTSAAVVPSWNFKSTMCLSQTQDSVLCLPCYYCMEVNAILLDRTEMYNQRLNYLHWNPVTAGFLAEPWHWIYSSAADYFTEKKGLPDLVVLDGLGSVISNREDTRRSPAPVEGAGMKCGVVS